MSCFRVLCLSLVCVACCAVSTGLAQQSVSFDEGFRLTAPQNWVVLDREGAGKMKKEVTGSNGHDLKDIPFEYVLYPRSGAPLDYPYILVRVHDQGRVPEPEIQQMNSQIKANLKKSDSAEHIANSTLSDFHYEAQRRLLRADMDFALKGAGTLRMANAMYYTNNGLLQLSLFCHEDESPTCQPKFERMVDSVRMEEGYGYTKSKLDQYPLFRGINFRELGRVLGTSFAIGGVLVLIYVVFMRRKK